MTKEILEKAIELRREINVLEKVKVNINNDISSANYPHNQEDRIASVRAMLVSDINEKQQRLEEEFSKL